MVRVQSNVLRSFIFVIKQTMFLMIVCHLANLLAALAFKMQYTLGLVSHDGSSHREWIALTRSLTHPRKGTCSGLGELGKGRKFPLKLGIRVVSEAETTATTTTTI